MKQLSTISLLIMLLMLSLTACKSKNDPDTPESETNEYAYIQGKSVKRGVSFSWQLDADFDNLGPAVSWSYNWGNTPAASQEKKHQQYGIQFVPMCWNNN